MCLFVLYESGVLPHYLALNETRIVNNFSEVFDFIENEVLCLLNFVLITEQICLIF